MNTLIGLTTTPHVHPHGFLVYLGVIVFATMFVLVAARVVLPRNPSAKKKVKS